MKHVFILLLICFGYLNVGAQNGKFSIELQKHLGGSYTTPYGMHEEPFGETRNNIKFSNAWHLGALYHFNDHWSMGLGVQYSAEGTYWRFDYPNNEKLTINFDYKYIRIPIWVQYTMLNSSNKLRPYVGLGVNFGWQQSYEEYVTTTSHGIIFIGYVNNPRHDFCINGQAGISYQITHRFKLNAGANMYHGITNFRPKELVSRLNTSDNANVTIRGFIGISMDI